MSDNIPQTAADRFAALIGPQREGKRVVEDAEFLKMLWRLVRALERRTTENPEMLTQVVALAQRLAEVVNVSIAISADRYALDPHRAASMMECARVMGISKQSASERRKTGNAVIAERLDAAGAVRLDPQRQRPAFEHPHTEAKREAAAIDAAAQHAAINLSDYRARHAA